MPPAASICEVDIAILSDGHCLAEQRLRLCPIRPANPRLQCDQHATAQALVSSGLGVTVVPQLATRDHARPNVVFRTFAGDGLSRVISLMNRRGGKPSPAAAQLLAHLMKLETISGME